MVLDVVVAVPGLTVAVPELDEAGAAFEEAAGHEALPGVFAGAVHVADVLGLLGNVEGVGGFALHAVGEFEAADAGLHLWVVAVVGEMSGVDFAEQVHLPGLAALAGDGIAEVLDHVLEVFDGGVEVGALKLAGEEGGAPVFGTFDGHAAGAH